jgi:hypothetical protein
MSSSPCTLLLSGVLSGSVRSAPSNAAIPVAKRAPAVNGDTNGHGWKIDQILWPTPVQPQKIRLVHRPGTASSYADPTSFGTSSPLKFSFEIWALDADSPEESQLSKVDTTNSKIASASGVVKYRLPWVKDVNPPQGWKQLLPLERGQEKGVLVHFLPSDAGKMDQCNIVLSLARPARAESSTGAVTPFRTRRLLVRGSYAKVSLMIY